MSEDRPENQGFGRIRQMLEEPYRQYWRNLGRLLHYFAQAEGDLIALLRTASGVTNEIGGALFHGTRVESAKDLINNVLESTRRSDVKDQLSVPLAQLATIATVRNNLVHWGVNHDGSDKLLVSNAHKYPNKIKEYRISAKDFDNIYFDIERINIWIILLDSYLDDGDPSELDRWGNYLRRPWLYMPPQPSPPKIQPQKDHRSRRPPRASSEA